MCSSTHAEEQIPNRVHKPRRHEEHGENKSSVPSVSPWFVWIVRISFDLRRTLAVHDHGVERLTLAEVDEVVRRGVVCVQLDEVL